MTVLYLLASLALAADPEPPERGELVVDARLPTEILFDGQPVCQLFFPSNLRVEVPAGEHTLRIYTNGTPEDVPVEVPSGSALHVLIGRTGTTVGAGEVELPDESPPQADIPGEIPVEFRVQGPNAVLAVVNRDRHLLRGGEALSLTLRNGTHNLSLRSRDGTVIWASGKLHIEGSEPIVVQVTEGRMPEVTGEGRFTSGG